MRFYLFPSPSLPEASPLDGVCQERERSGFHLLEYIAPSLQCPLSFHRSFDTTVKFYNLKSFYEDVQFLDHLK